MKHVILAALLAVTLAACGGAAATPTSAPTAAGSTESPPEPTPTSAPDIVILALNPQFSNAPFFVAMEEGYFAEQNIEIVIQEIQSTSESLALVVSGDLDVVSGAVSSGLINLLAAEPGVRVVTNKGYSPEDGCLAPAMVIRRDLAESGALDSAESMRGLKFVGRLSSFSGFTYQTWLENDYGLTLDDIVLEDVPQDALIDALANGAVDVATATDPLLTRILDAGNAVVAKSYGQLIPDMEYSYVLYGARLTGENRDLGNRFMVAYLKAVRQLYAEGKSDHNIETLVAATGLERELVERMCWLDLNPTGEISFATVQAFQEWALSHGLIDRMLAEQEYWDSGFIEYANQVLGAP